MIRGSGAESELALSYGVIGQLLASAELGAREMPPATTDPLVAGADLAALLGQAHATTGRLVVLAVDDLHWADHGSAAALLCEDCRGAASRCGACQVLANSAVGGVATGSKG